jgi:hypothetical protein
VIAGLDSSGAARRKIDADIGRTEKSKESVAAQGDLAAAGLTAILLRADEVIE